MVFDPVATVGRVAVVPAWSDLADAERLSVGDIDGREWISMPCELHPGFAAWAGPAVEHSRSAPVVRHPAAVSAAVALTGALGLHSAAAERFYPRPDVRFVSIDGDPCSVAIASRYGDGRPTVAAFRRAAALVAQPGQLPVLTSAG